MPWYNKPLFNENEFKVVFFDGFIHQIHHTYQVLVHERKHNVLGYELYLVKIPDCLIEIKSMVILMKVNSL